MATQQEKLIFFMRKAKILVEDCMDKNGDDDLILPLGANRVLSEIAEALEEEIDRADDYEEYDPG
mgnify:FL=1|tara:strand:- start:237 stop:431 length:195 start_codon:yes stop_codon:yes gene_type:complete